MTSEIQQLLDTLMNYCMDEQQKFLEIVDRINEIMKGASQREKKIQQEGASNNNKPETPKTIPKIPENWKDLRRDELHEEKRMQNTIITQMVSQ